MGADIHAFIELKYKNSSYYESIAKLFISRSYFLFGLMAGVRGEEIPIFQPKGIPEDLGCMSKGEYYYYASDDDPKVIEEWVKDGLSTVYDKEHNIITNPDWHTPSWLSKPELKLIKEALRDKYGVTNTELNAVIAMMNTLDKFGESRLVFWFDN